MLGVAYSPDGDTLATTSNDKTARLWRLNTPSKPAVAAGPPWWEPFASLLAYTVSIDWDFPDGGLIDLVPAGRQGGGYATRVTSFDWGRFYQESGGGVLLEAVKEQLREDYDFVLVDSRTGLADTAGICTVQMPDELVVCFTLNHQSIQGASAVAASADRQRRRPSGEPSLRIWPVPTRIDLAEKERLDIARLAARQAFGAYVRHVPRRERETYWGGVEVVHQAYYAYEEILATIADHPGQTLSMLASMEALASGSPGGRTSACRNCLPMSVTTSSTGSVGRARWRRRPPRRSSTSRIRVSSSHWPKRSSPPVGAWASQCGGTRTSFQETTGKRPRRPRGSTRARRCSCWGPAPRRQPDT